MMHTNTPKETLVEIYTEFVRPVIEYASVLYGTLLTGDLSEKIENLQKMALKIIFGHSRSYVNLLELAGLVTLEERRNNAIEKFAVKSLNKRFSGRWFEENDSRGLRHTERLKIKKANQNRLK